MTQTTLEQAASSIQAKEHDLPSFKQPAPQGPAALPRHIRPVGKHYQFADSQWWIGYAYGAYAEVAHLQGVVIYDQVTHIFLKLGEIDQASALLPELIQQGQDQIERDKQQQQRELAL